jgi:hypothetical protein
LTDDLAVVIETLRRQRRDLQREMREARTTETAALLKKIQDLTDRMNAVLKKD